MGDLTKNFNRREFACKCHCGMDTVDFTLVRTLQYLIDEFKEKTNEEVFILITSGNRCVGHNAKVGGSPNSMHLKAKAADFKVYRKNVMDAKGKPEQVDPDLIANILDRWFPKSKGIGRYKNRTHLDSRDIKARWDTRK